MRKSGKAFNLEPAKVNEVFEEERKEHLKVHEARLESMLEQLVKDKRLS